MSGTRTAAAADGGRDRNRDWDRDRDEDGADARAQAFTLEAVAAAVVVLGSLLFALQVAGVTATTASTASGQVPAQQGAVAEGLVDAAAANGSLRPTLLYWDAANGRFHGVPAGADRSYYTVGPPTAFGASLNRTLDDRAVAYNVNVLYPNGSGAIRRAPVVRSGRPGDDAARGTRTVTLYDDDRLRFANGTRSDRTLGNTSYLVPDRYPDGPVYSVVRVEVVVWRV